MVSRKTVNILERPTSHAILIQVEYVYLNSDTMEILTCNFIFLEWMYVYRVQSSIKSHARTHARTHTRTHTLVWLPA